jgi:hypothetical protein
VSAVVPLAELDPGAVEEPDAGAADIAAPADVAVMEPAARLLLDPAAVLPGLAAVLLLEHPAISASAAVAVRAAVFNLRLRTTSPWGERLSANGRQSRGNG